MRSELRYLTYALAFAGVEKAIESMVLVGYGMGCGYGSFTGYALWLRDSQQAIHRWNRLLRYFL